MNEKFFLHHIDPTLSETTSNNIHSALQKAQQKIETGQLLSSTDFLELREQLNKAQRQISTQVDHVFWENLNPSIPFEFPRKEKYSQVASFTTDQELVTAIGPNTLISRRLTQDRGQPHLPHALTLQEAMASRPNKPMLGKPLPGLTYKQTSPHSIAMQSSLGNRLDTCTYQPVADDLEYETFRDLPSLPILILPSGDFFCVESGTPCVKFYQPKGASSGWQNEEKLEIQSFSLNPSQATTPDGISYIQKLLERLPSRVETSAYVPGTGLLIRYRSGELFLSCIFDLQSDGTFFIKPFADAENFTTNAEKSLVLPTLLPDGRFLNTSLDETTLVPTSLQRDPTLSTETLFTHTQQEKLDVSSGCIPAATQLGPNRFLVKRRHEMVIMEKQNGQWQATEQLGRAEIKGRLYTISRYVVFPDGKIAVQYKESFNNGGILTRVFNGKVYDRS